MNNLERQSALYSNLPKSEESALFSHYLAGILECKKWALVLCTARFVCPITAQQLERSSTQEISPHLLLSLCIEHETSELSFEDIEMQLNNFDECLAQIENDSGREQKECSSSRAELIHTCGIDVQHLETELLKEFFPQDETRHLLTPDQRLDLRHRLAVLPHPSSPKYEDCREAISSFISCFHQRYNY